MEFENLPYATQQKIKVLESCGCPECEDEIHLLLTTYNVTNYPNMEGNVERTLVLLKPDAYERNLVGEIMSVIDDRGLSLVGAKQMTMDKQMVEKHYKNHLGKGFFPNLVEFMTSGPTLALVYEGNKACQAVRQLIGEKHPTNSPPGSIRGKYASEYPRNLIHGSDDPSEANYEIALYFDESELFGSNYKKNLATILTNKKKKAAALKAEVINAGVKVGSQILYPEMVKKGMTIVQNDYHTAYLVTDVKKTGGLYLISLLNNAYKDFSTPDKKTYSVTLEYAADGETFQGDNWKLLFS